ncbi:MAG: TonB-dependent receptor [Hyphomicrobiaceae bacterium]
MSGRFVVKPPAARIKGAALAAAIGCALVSQANAQTQLPGIEVTTPSPVTKPIRKSPPARAAKEVQSRPRGTPTPSPTPAAVSAPPLDEVPLPGSLVVVDDAFAAITVVTERDLLASPGPTIADTLALRPGITSSTFSPGSNRPVIRGLDTYRVRIQENGIGTADVAALSEDHGVPIDPFAAERVEVVRGPATLRYGSQAIGGVVSVENNRIPMFIPPRGYSAELKGGLSSGDLGRDGAFQVTSGAGNVAVHVDAFKRRTFDYDTPHGTQANTFVDAKGVSLGGSWIWADGFFGVAWTRYQSLYGIPGEEAEEAKPRIDLLQDKLTAKGEWRVRDHGIEAIRLWLGSSRYGHNEVVRAGAHGHGDQDEHDHDHDHDHVEEMLSGDMIGTRFTNREREARAEVQHMPVRTSFGEFHGAAGIQWGDKRMRGFGVEEPVDGLLDPVATQSMIAGFLFEELEVTRRLRLQAAGRIEGSASEGTGVENPLVATDPEKFSRDFTPVSGSLGMLYELPLGVVARLTAQHTERAPDLGELYSKGVHEATGTFEIGNPDLGVEKANTIELGFKRAKGAFRFDASVFHTVYDGFIFKSFTGRKCDDTLDTCGTGEELDELVFAQRDARFTGAELGGELDVGRVGRGIWGVSGQYDFVRARFEGGDNVPRIPPHRLGAGLYYRDLAWRASLSGLHAFRQNDVFALDVRDTPTNGYTMLNAELAYTFKTTAVVGDPTEMTIGLRGENLLDDDIRNHVSFKKDEVLQPGRTIRLFGSIKLN